LNKRFPALHRRMLRAQGFTHELWRRRFIQSIAAYGVVAWIIIEVSSVVFPAFNAPPIYLQSVIGMFVIGLPIVGVLSWIFDFTPEGLIRTEDLDSAEDLSDDSPETQTTRRQLTILYATVSIEQDAGHDDPEELLEILPRALEICNKICQRYQGTITPARTGELLVYFGYPLAMENASRSAIRAALNMIDGILRVNQSESAESGINISFSAAVHTGEVVVEETLKSDAKEPEIVGLLPMESSKLLSRCGAEELFISEAAYNNVKGFFNVVELDAVEGSSGKAYRVLNENQARNRVEAQSDDQLLPCLGRELEISQLQQHWRRALDGQGQVVNLVGGTGIGKSRLVLEIKNSVTQDPKNWLNEYHCDAIAHDTPLAPVVDFFQRELFDGSEQESNEEALSKIEGLLAEYNQEQSVAVPLIASLLGVALNESYKPTSDSPQRLRQLTMELIVDMLTARASRQPILLVMEDLHWADPSTVELLGLLIEQIPTLPIMCILTFRPEFIPSWGQASHISSMNLASLDTIVAQSICNSIESSLSPEIVKLIADKSDGVPLFVEEVTRSIVEKNLSTGSDAKLQQFVNNIPATLKDALAARLDNLGKARPVAQLGATIGRNFGQKLLTRVAIRLKAKLVDNGLRMLVEPEIIYKLGTGEKASYRFKHALIQDAAYQSLITKQRKHYHAAIADVIEKEFPDVVASNPEILAHHYALSKSHKKSIDYRIKAATKAMQTAATEEALSHLQKGLSLCAEMAAGLERNIQELTLQTTIGSASMFAFGYASEQAHDAYTEAEKLCDDKIPLPFAVPVIMGLSAYHSVRGAAVKGQQQNVRILEIAEKIGDRDLLLWGNAFTCVGNFYEGKLEKIDKYLEQVLELYNFEMHRDLCTTTSQDPKVFAMLHASQAAWMRGYPDKALKLAREKDELAIDLQHPLVYQQALGWGNVVFLYRKEPELLLENAQKAHALASEQRIPFYVGGNLVWWGASIAEQGNHESGVEMMREGLDVLEETGAKIGRPLMLTLVASSLGKIGKQEEGLNDIESALAQVEQWGERFFLAEIHRVQGDLYQQLDKPEDAEKAYLTAIDVAQQQQAKSWELRARTSLTRLHAKQGREQESVAALQETYDWFEEGFDTFDLIDAREVIKNHMVEVEH
jgi:predicted ATPase/class 3 adenylate cyclase